jgi:ATP-dependent DNA helicase RecG
MRDVYACCNRYNQTQSEFSGLRRIDGRDYPESAVREGLINMLVHRDYTVRDSAIISIFDNRMEFTKYIIGPGDVLSVVLNKVQKFTIAIIFSVKIKNILPKMNVKIKIF